MGEKSDKAKKIAGRVIGVIVLVLILLLVVLSWGVYDLLQDDVYLFVTENKDVAKAATYYVQSSDSEKIVNIEPYPALNDLGAFYISAEEEFGEIDRMLVIDLTVIEEFTTEPLSFRENSITKSDLVLYLEGSKPIPEELRADDVADWETRSHMLGNWVRKYNRDVIGTAAKHHDRVAELYRDGLIKIRKQNGALIMLKILPLENFVKFG